MTKDDLIAIIDGVRSIQTARRKQPDRNYVQHYADRACEQLCVDLVAALQHAPADVDRDLLLATARTMVQSTKGSV